MSGSLGVVPFLGGGDEVILCPVGEGEGPDVEEGAVEGDAVDIVVGATGIFVEVLGSVGAVLGAEVTISGA